MSNLLNRMAARALRTAPLAQPVVPTLFTPNAGLAQNAADVSGADLHSEVEAAAPATTTADRGAFRHKSIHDPAAQNFFVSRIENSKPSC